jgi:monoterpene epsilon-lactone hydrolase
MSLRAELLRLGLRRFVKSRSGPIPDLEASRKGYDAIKRFIPDPPRGTKVTRLAIGSVKAVRVATTQSLADRHVLYLHGGGYINGSPSHYRDFIWRVADATSACVLCIDYRLAPEHPFPAALDDAVAAYRWLLADGAAPGRIAVMGDSAGGGLTFATLLRLRDDGLPMPAAAVALSPWTDLALTGESIRTNARAESMLSAEQAPAIASHYLAGADPRNPYVSPLFGDPAGLPPALIQVGSDEVLYDDAVRMADRLRASGCSVALEIWPRMPHGWQLFARVLPEARKAVVRIGAFVQREMSSATQKL